MRVRDLPELGSPKIKHEEPLSEVVLAAQDAPTTRRALLTGGVVVAGAAITSNTASAAVTYVKLGTLNTATANTTIRSSSARAIVGSTTAASSQGVFGVSTGQNGAGVQGIAHVGSNASGVQGSSNSGAGVRGNSTDRYGVYGTGGYSGVYGSGASYGVIGSASSGYGVYGSGSTGVYASGGSGGYGVQAYGGTYGVYAGGASYGVYAEGATGVYGSSGSGRGVQGATSNVNAAAVYGTGGQYGLQGANARTAGVRGDSPYVGVWGEGGDWGFFSIATKTSGQNYGMMGESKSAAGYGGYFKGRVHVEGMLTKGAGAFKIDHPLDPERKWLQHSFVESPDMMNVYNGNVTTDAAGLAIVELPAYFDALNRDFRYQLTVIGTMAQAIVDKEIANNRFRIRTSKGRVKVSWQVTGIRQDDYAKSHRIKVELLKRKADQGTRTFLPPGAVGRLMEVGPGG